MIFPGAPVRTASVIPPPDGAPRPMSFVHIPMQQTCRRLARRRAHALLWLCLGAACNRTPQSEDAARTSSATPAGATLFTRLPSSETGVTFANNLTESSDLNVFTYRNFYNGGGVAIGDLTGDGLPEIVLTSNQGGAKLFLNEGRFHFRDITAAAGLDAKKRAWTTGVVLADVDGDGKLDIYLSHAGQAEPAARRNTLWINQGVGADSIPTFREEGEQYGVADEGYTTQAAFFDYDRDGDLDLFLINNSPRPVSSFGQRNTRNVRDPYGGHKLYRNDGGHFTDVSARAGIFGSEIAFGLGLGIADVNRDGWPDIYVSNDFFERDYLYLNKHDGTFDEALDRSTNVDSYFSMGMDMADVDNDGWPDIYTTDMLPENEFRLRTMASFEGWDVYQAKVANGYGHQYMRNMLQRNDRDGSFTDVGQMAGVARTDWSWSALIADLDLDGKKDIFVTNGLVKDVTSQDYIAFLANQETMDDATSRGKVDYLKLINAMKSTPIPNYAFRNNGKLAFSNVAAAWGLDTPSFSSGAAYGDLDGDGAPDLVVNNTNEEAFVYRNDAHRVPEANRWLQVRLEGEGKNTHAIGARVTVVTGADTMMQEVNPTRGVQSSMDYVLTFGLGARDSVSQLRVEWPDGGASALGPTAGGQRVVIAQGTAPQAAPEALPQDVAPGGLLVARAAAAQAIPFAHRENSFVDFDRERLIPKMLSTEGPAMAVGDVDGDGLDDVYIGGAKEQAGSLLLQRANGGWTPVSAATFAADAISEDVGATFLDVDGDGDLDLFVVSGGNEFSDMASGLQDRLYINNGRGQFTKRAESIPFEFVSGSRPAAIDYDGDGDVDLFVGGRVVPWHYGETPTSTLLQNDGKGNFTDVTAQLAPELQREGMVTDAIWQDLDGDNRPELIVVGEWMPITIFHNDGGGKLSPMKVPGLARSNGWWNRIVKGDFNGDGRVDFIVGNLGLNTRLHASDTAPTTMLVKDFDGNGYVEQVVACYTDGKRYPIALRDELIKSIPPLKARYLNYGDYARATVEEIFPAQERAGAIELSVYTFASAMLRNDGNGNFTLVPLPAEAQVAPIYGILPHDLDGDGNLDLLLAGNFDGFKPDIGRASEGRGLVLMGDGKGGFAPLLPHASGFEVPGQVRDIESMRARNGTLFVVARNNDTPLVFRPARPQVAQSNSPKQ